MTRTRGGVRWVVVAAVALAACGGGDDEPAATTRPLTALEQEVAEQLRVPEVGMTDAERECVARALAEGETVAQEAIDRTAPFDTLSAALADLAPDCVTPARREVLQAAYDEIAAEGEAEVDAALEQVYVAGFVVGGATQVEAECMAAVQVSLGDAAVPDTAQLAAGAPELEPFADCAAAERLVEIFAGSYAIPRRRQLEEAGATADEAACLVATIPRIDLWFPANLTGDDAAEEAASLFVADGAACGPAERLREIALELHRQG